MKMVLPLLASQGLGCVQKELKPVILSKRSCKSFSFRGGQCVHTCDSDGMILQAHAQHNCALASWSSVLINSISTVHSEHVFVVHQVRKNLDLSRIRELIFLVRAAYVEGQSLYASWKDMLFHYFRCFGSFPCKQRRNHKEKFSLFFHKFCSFFILVSPLKLEFLVRTLHASFYIEQLHIVAMALQSLIMPRGYSYFHNHF